MITQLFTLAPFNLKILFTKPLIYIIQLFTWNKREHSALLVDGIVINMSGKGWEEIPYQEWLAEYKINGVKVEALDCDCSQEQIDKIKTFSKIQLGKIDYSVIGAIKAAWYDIFSRKNASVKGSECAKSTFDSLVAGSIFPASSDLLTPAKLRKLEINSGLFKLRGFI